MTDVLAWLEDAIAAARTTAAEAVDRAEALVELRSLALSAAERAESTTLTPDQLHSFPRDETERARLNAVLARAIPDIPTANDNDERPTP